MTISDKLTLLEQTKEAQRIKLGLPESVPFSQYVKLMRDPFTPDEIFKNGEQGVWLDPSDLTTMFQNVVGIVPVTKDGDPVGLILDKSEGLFSGEYIDFDLLELNPERSDDNVEVTHTDGAIIYDINRMVTSNYVAIPFTIGKYYSLTLDIENLSSYSLEIKSSGGGASPTITKVEANEHLKGTFVFRASYSTRLYFRASRAKVKVNSVKIKEIKGNHATQETATSRPVYRTDGELHWLEFDGVDDSLDVNLTATNSYDLSISFNYLGNSAGLRRLVNYNGSSNLIFASASNANFNLFNTSNGLLEDTNRRTQGIKVITAYLSATVSSYIGQSGKLNNLPSELSNSVNSLHIGVSTSFDLYGLIFRDSSQFYPDVSKQLHSYVQRKAGEYF